MEPWTNAIPLLTSHYSYYSINPVLCILINNSLSTAPLLATLQKDHPTINFCPYRTLITAQTRIGWRQLRYG
eukprot:5014699-Ditylum_brightwellii.AAC.1